MSKFKVLLVYPNLQMINLLPSNIGVLAACLKQNGFDVKVFDSTLYKTEDKSLDEIRVEHLQLRPFNLSEKGVEYKKTDIYNDFQKAVKHFKPNLIVVEKAFFSKNRNASLLNVLVDEIKSIAKKKRIRYVDYAPSTVKKHICGNGRAGKEEVARVVVSKYPELKVYLTQDREWKTRFHMNMFDAVSLGIIAIRLCYCE